MTTEIYFAEINSGQDELMYRHKQYKHNKVQQCKNAILQAMFVKILQS